MDGRPQTGLTGLDTGSNLQKLKAPEISSGLRQEKRDKPGPRLTELVLRTGLDWIPDPSRRGVPWIPDLSSKTEGTVSKPNFTTK